MPRPWERGWSWCPRKGTEAGDLEALRKGLKGLNVEGVVVGAIAPITSGTASQRVRVAGAEVVRSQWRKDQLLLLRDMVDAGVKAIIVGVFAEGLDENG